MSDEATAVNYLASSLVNPEEEDYAPLDPETEAWMDQQGMYEDEKRNMRYQMRRHQKMETERQATQAPHHFMTTPPSEREIPAFRGAGTMSQYVEPERLVEEAKEFVRTTPTIGEVTGAKAAMTPPPPEPLPKVIEEGPDGPDVTSQRSPIRAVRGPDGNIVFTNVGTEAPAGQDISYREGVKAFRGKMRRHQEGLGPAPPGRIGATGVPIPGGHILGDPDAPLPGDPDYAEGGFVSTSYMADPTKALAEEDWAAMSPGARRAFAEQAGQVSGIRQAGAAGRLAEHEAQVATDPEYRTMHRTALRDRYVNEAKTDPGVLSKLQIALDEVRKQLPDLTEDSPEFVAMRSEAERRLIEEYLQRTYASVAPWDDELSRNVGLSL